MWENKQYNIYQAYNLKQILTQQVRKPEKLYCTQLRLFNIKKSRYKQVHSHLFNTKELYHKVIIIVVDYCSSLSKQIHLNSILMLSAKRLLQRYFILGREKINKIWQQTCILAFVQEGFGLLFSWARNSYFGLVNGLNSLKTVVSI